MRSTVVCLSFNCHHIGQIKLILFYGVVMYDSLQEFYGAVTCDHPPPGILVGFHVDEN